MSKYKRAIKGRERIGDLVRAKSNVDCLPEFKKGGVLVVRDALDTPCGDNVFSIMLPDGRTCYRFAAYECELVDEG